MAEVFLLQVKLRLSEYLFVAEPLFDHLLDINFPVVEQTYFEVTICCDSQPIAAAAEMLTH